MINCFGLLRFLRLGPERRTIMSTNYKDDILLRLPQVLHIIPISRSSWLAGVKSGEYPQPVRVSRRCVCWRLSDIHALLQEKEAGHE